MTPLKLDNLLSANTAGDPTLQNHLNIFTFTLQFSSLQFLLFVVMVIILPFI